MSEKSRPQAPEFQKSDLGGKEPLTRKEILEGHDQEAQEPGPEVPQRKTVQFRSWNMGLLKREVTREDAYDDEP